MKGYSESDVFKPEDLAALAFATKFVAPLPAEIFGAPVRCHELARAVCVALGWDVGTMVCDGWFGMVDHSWIWLAEPLKFSCPPHILDVYQPGSLPQVQIHDMASVGLLRQYRRGPVRTDIKNDVVLELLRRM